MSSHGQRKLLQSAKKRARAPPWAVRTQREVREPAQESRECDLRFEPRQRLPETEVGAVPEGEAPVVGATDVELVRPREHLGVAVGRADHRDDEVVAAYDDSAQLHVLRHGAACRERSGTSTRR